MYCALGSRTKLRQAAGGGFPASPKSFQAARISSDGQPLNGWAASGLESPNRAAQTSGPIRPREARYSIRPPICSTLTRMKLLRITAVVFGMELRCFSLFYAMSTHVHGVRVGSLQTSRTVPFMSALLPKSDVVRANGTFALCHKQSTRG